MFKGILSTIGSIFGPVRDVIDELHTSKEEKSAAQIQLSMIQAEAELNVMKHVAEITKSQADVLLGEINGESWMQRNWRPCLMFVGIIILFNNFVVAPYIDAFGGVNVMLQLPDEIWLLLNIGMGGYIGARTWEKRDAMKLNANLEQIRLTQGKNPDAPNAPIVIEDNDH